MFFWKGEFYTRAEVIKMHANALGGVHFDFRKAQDEAHIKEIKNYLGFELKGSNNQILVGDEIGQGRADPVWAAAGSKDTELGVKMEPEVGHGATEIYPRVQA